MHPELVDGLAMEAKTKIIFYILDGVGGLPMEEGGPTELEAASTPNLDSLAKKSICGMLDPVSPGITPGSGPGHFALFGYDPVETIIGRGVLEAAGIDFPLEDGDVAARGNFATLDKNGLVIDRRAGRPSDEKNRELVEKIRRVLTPQEGVKFFLETVKEHRVVLVLRGEGLSEALPDTDPQAV
ncbi:MAG: phosphoglycerate mutase, partial [Planctomycetes bacterium DG_23]